jgi:hypothetical protein
MITAIVRYKLRHRSTMMPALLTSPGSHPAFREAKGLLSKHFIWSERGIAGGVYQWQTLEDAKAFYSGPWRKGIVERYGMEPEIEFFDVFAVTDNVAGTVKVTGEPRKHAASVA